MVCDVCTCSLRFHPFVCGWCVKELNLIEVLERMLHLNRKSLGATNRSVGRSVGRSDIGLSVLRGMWSDIQLTDNSLEL